MAYSKKTCCKCGWKDIQPNMIQRVRLVDVAKGRGSVSAATIAGAMLGDKASGRKVRNTIFNTGQRTYQRKVTSWFCPDCAAKEPKNLSGSVGSTLRVIGAILVFIIFFPFIREFSMGMFDGFTNGSSSENAQNSSPDGTFRENLPNQESEVSEPAGGVGTVGQSSKESVIATSAGMTDLLFDTDFFGGDIFPYGIKGQSLEDCLNWCLAEVDCKGISFVPSRQECYPKNELNSGRAAPGVISSRRF